MLEVTSPTLQPRQKALYSFRSHSDAEERAHHPEGSLSHFAVTEELLLLGSSPLYPQRGSTCLQRPLTFLVLVPEALRNQPNSSITWQHNIYLGTTGLEECRI